MLKRINIKNALVGVFAASLFVFAAASSVSAATYNCGTYGASSYNGNCPPSSSSGGGGSSSGGSPETPAAEGEKVVLNDFEEYTTDEGKTVEVSKDQVIYFNLLDGSTTVEHYISVAEVGADYVIVRIDGSTSDIRLKLGQPLRYDVDGDGTPDIEITLISVNGVLAAVNFKQLDQPEKSSDDSSAKTEQADDPDSGWSLGRMLAVGLGVLLLLAGIIWAFKTWRGGKSGPNSGAGGSNVIYPS